jgi:hypothetical protein
MEENKLVLDLNIKGQKISCQKPEFDLVENSVGYLQLKLNYSPDWKGLYKLVFFQTPSKTLVASGDNGLITVPHEIIKAPGFRVSCVGTDVGIKINSDHTLGEPIVKVRITTDQIPIALKLGGPMRGVLGELTSSEIGIYELASLALKVAKEAYTLAWDIGQGLKDVNDILGGGITEYKDIRYRDDGAIELVDEKGYIHVLTYDMKDGKIIKTYLDGQELEAEYDGRQVIKIGNAIVDISGIFN